MFAGSLLWRPQERHKREAVGGDTVRPWACDAGCSIMLITCPSRISLLRILPPPRAASVCLFITYYRGPRCLRPGSSANPELVQLCVSEPSSAHHQHLPLPLRWDQSCPCEPGAEDHPPGLACSRLLASTSAVFPNLAGLLAAAASTKASNR
jgi:hypothetical protein